MMTDQSHSPHITLNVNLSNSRSPTSSNLSNSHQQYSRFEYEITELEELCLEHQGILIRYSKYENLQANEEYFVKKLLYKLKLYLQKYQIHESFSNSYENQSIGIKADNYRPWLKRTASLSAELPVKTIRLNQDKEIVFLMQSILNSSLSNFSHTKINNSLYFALPSSQLLHWKINETLKGFRFVKYEFWQYLNANKQNETLSTDFQPFGRLCSYLNLFSKTLEECTSPLLWNLLIDDYHIFENILNLSDEMFESIKFCQNLIKFSWNSYLFILNNITRTSVSHFAGKFSVFEKSYFKTNDCMYCRCIVLQAYKSHMERKFAKIEIFEFYFVNLD
jgi:hypothetical protein